MTAHCQPPHAPAARPRITPAIDEARLREVETRIRRSFGVAWNSDGSPAGNAGRITQADFNFVFDTVMILMGQRA